MVTIYSSLIIYVITLLISFDYPITVDQIKDIDGGGVIFLLLILAFSQLHANIAFRVFLNSTDKITITDKAALGVWSTILAIISIYGLMGIYYFTTGVILRHQ